MKAIILAAGSGNRMRPLTDTMHKTLLRVGEETVLARIVLNLREVGIEAITVVTGYRAEDIKTHLSDRFPTLAIHYVHNPDYSITNNLVSLRLAMESIEIDSDVVLIESDLVFDATILQRLLSSHHANVALVDRYAPGMDGTVVTLDGPVITGVIPPHLQGRDFSFQDKFKTLNIYRFSRDFCLDTFRGLLNFYASTQTNKCYYELVLGVIIYLHSAPIHAEIVEGETWSEIDDPNDLEIARYAFVPPTRSRTLARSHGGFWNYKILDFCYLRNPFFPSPSIVSELKNSFGTVIGQYGSSQPILDRKMSYFEMCRPERIVALNGLSQIYPWLAHWFQGRQALVPTPTFGEYDRAFPGAQTYADGEKGFDLGQIESRIADVDVVCFVNPNNPTGSLLKSGWIYDLAACHRKKTFIVDESFIDFSSETSILRQLEQSDLPNVIVLKSLSKALGVPGLRLGWAYSSNEEFLERLRGVLPVWNLNSIAENFLEIILKHRLEIVASFERTRSERHALAGQLDQLPFVECVYNSHANFLLVRFRSTPERLEEKIEELVRGHGIYVKSCQAKFEGDRALARIAVNLPEENEQLIKGLRCVFGVHE
jgi:histidinol-phosphate/aromatic aminotransferase/cobyric acid decarboxylase-like protein/choline kinase